MLRRMEIGRVWLLWAGLLLPTVAHAQDRQVVYVSDYREVMVRTGPSLDNKIIAMLKTGEAVEIVERVNDDYYLISLPDGRQGYIVSGYVTDREPAAYRVRRLEAQLAESTRETARLREENEGLHAALETTRSAATAQGALLVEVTDERDRLKRNATPTYFLAGAGVLLVGWLLGWTRLRLRRRVPNRLE